MRTSKKLNQLRERTFVPQAPKLEPIKEDLNENSLSGLHLDARLKQTDNSDADHSEIDARSFSDRNKLFRSRKVDRSSTNPTFENPTLPG